MLQPARVLPSNAPPLQEDNDNLHHTSRILQEHSGNRQQHISNFSSSNDWDQSKYLYDQQKYPANVLTGENAYHQHHDPAQHRRPHQHIYHPQPQHRNTWRYGYGSRGYSHHDPNREAQIRCNAERLYQQFVKSEQYVKYRARQQKEDKGNGDQKWPDHLEKAFFRALITYPPMGRRKQLHKDKQRGRNELIADCIEDLTGENRTRKQVSSHIQVLKPFVEGNSAIMKWLSKDDMFANVPRIHGQPYASGRLRSTFTAPPYSAMRSTTVPPPRLDAHGVQLLKGDSQAFEPNEFQMFIQRKYLDSGGSEGVDRLHTYSQALQLPLGDDLPMSDWHTIARDFPQLAEANAQRPLDCTVLIAEASLAFNTEPVEKWKDRKEASIELGIYFQCRSRQLAASKIGMKNVVTLQNRFYERGVEDRNVGETTEVTFRDVPGSPAAETEIKFGSKFWARKLGDTANKLREPTEDVQRQRDEVASYIRSLSALQEVYVSTDTGEERIMIIHWKFRLSSRDCGSASWRRLLLPDHTAPQLKADRSDSIHTYDYANAFSDLTSAQQQAQTQPTLQSPFEYDSSSGSALSSVTWPTTISHGSGIGGPNDAFATDNDFDFNAGSINIAYDSTFNFDNLDSSAFNFDTTTDFAADPTLQDFTQTPWYDNGFDSQQSVGLNSQTEDASFATQPDLESTQIYNFPGHYDAQTYTAPHDQQAYGGAGQDLLKEEDALAALADASFLARTMGTK